MLRMRDPDLSSRVGAPFMFCRMNRCLCPSAAINAGRPVRKAALHSEDQNWLLISQAGSRLGGEARLSRPKSRYLKRLFRDSLQNPCKFPGRSRIACVHAGSAMKFFLAGKFSLLSSLRRESMRVGSRHRIVLNFGSRNSVHRVSTLHPSRNSGVKRGVDLRCEMVYRVGRFEVW